MTPPRLSAAVRERIERISVAAWNDDTNVLFDQIRALLGYYAGPDGRRYAKLDDFPGHPLPDHTP